MSDKIMKWQFLNHFLKIKLFQSVPTEPSEPVQLSLHETLPLAAGVGQSQVAEGSIFVILRRIFSWNCIILEQLKESINCREFCRVPFRMNDKWRTFFLQKWFFFRSFCAAIWTWSRVSLGSCFWNGARIERTRWSSRADLRTERSARNSSTLLMKLLRAGNPGRKSVWRFASSFADKIHNEDIQVKRRIRIEGAELEAYRRMKAEKEAETARLRWVFSFY